MSSPYDVVQTLESALEAVREPALGPQPKDVYRAHQWEMAGAHAMFINALKGIYEQAPSIPKNKAQDFAGYVLIWCAILHHHHTFEEETYFTLFEPRLDKSIIVDEHEAFLGGVIAFEEYLVSCLPPGTPYGFQKTAPAHDIVEYDGNHVRSLIEVFADPLVTHLQQEITYLDPAKLRAAGFTEAELKHIQQVESDAMKVIPPTVFLTFVILTRPKWCDGFPPAPWFLTGLLVPYVFARMNTHFWQFVPRQ